jgi:hypothetical protein
MEYVAPQLTLVGSASHIVLGGPPFDVYEGGVFDMGAALEAEW